MDFEKKAEYIRKCLNEKNINMETQEQIIRYVYVNQKLFGNILNIDNIIERILNNLEHSIDNKSFSLREKILHRYRGYWSPYNHKIWIDPILKIKSSISRQEKIGMNSTIMHEIDHCATTKYINMSDQELDKYIDMLKRIIKVPKGNKQKEKLCRRMFNNGELEICGIVDTRQFLLNRVPLKLLRGLNEGITAYKQELYDEFYGNEAHTAYRIEKKFARFLADVIGKENLITTHFNNDYEGMNSLFNEKTGKNLSELIYSMQSFKNKPSRLMTCFFGKHYYRHFYNSLDKSIDKVLQKNFSIEKNQKRNTDFIPKVSVNYSQIKNNLENSRHINEKEQEEIR